MIAWLAAAALAAPELDAAPVDPWSRCVERADREAGLNGPVGLQAFPVGGVPRLAVVVGVPCHYDPALPSLAYATRDATQVADWLADEGYAVIRLTTEVEQSEIEHALDLAARHLRPDGTLVVYFSGHGVIHEARGRLQRMLVFTDTRLDDLGGTGMPLSALDARLGSIEAAHRVLIQDTCFAGDGGKSVSSGVGVGLAGTAKGPKGVLAPEGTALELRPGDHRLYAARFFEQAEESPLYRGSVYTHHLLAALRDGAGDLDGDACIGLREAHLYAQARTDADRHGLQRPVAQDWDGQNLQLTACTGVPTAAVITVPAQPPGWVVEIDGGEPLDAPTPVPPGVYPVRVVRESEVHDGEQVTTKRDALLAQKLTLQPGQWVEPADELRVRDPVAVAEAVVEVSGTRGVLPPSGFGASAWWMPRDRGFGRPLVGATLVTLPKGAVTWADERIACFGGGHLDARAGWTWTIPVDASIAQHLGIGPVASLGGWWRDAMHAGGERPRPCRDQGTGRVALGTELATGGTGTLHVHVANARWVASFDQGVLWVGTQTLDGLTPSVQPWVRAAFGIRL